MLKTIIQKITFVKQHIFLYLIINLFIKRIFFNYFLHIYNIHYLKNTHIAISLKKIIQLTFLKYSNIKELFFNVGKLFLIDKQNNKELQLKGKNGYECKKELT